MNRLEDDRRSPYQRWILLLILLLVGGLLFLILWGVLQNQTERDQAEVIPVDLHSELEADYGAAPQAVSLPRTLLNLIWDAIYDSEPGLTDLEARQAAVLNSLLTPVPTVTPLPCQGEQLIVASQDTWVSAANPAANYGTEPTLQLANNNDRILLAFSLFEAVPPGVFINRAWLELTVIDPPAPPVPPARFFNLADSFDETTSTGANIPPLAAAYNIAGQANGDVHLWDVTAIVRDWLLGPHPQPGLALEPIGQIARTVSYHSREGAAQIQTGANSSPDFLGPRLIIDCGGQPTRPLTDESIAAAGTPRLGPPLATPTVPPDSFGSESNPTPTPLLLATLPIPVPTELPAGGDPPTSEPPSPPPTSPPPAPPSPPPAPTLAPSPTPLPPPPPPDDGGDDDDGGSGNPPEPTPLPRLSINNISLLEGDTGTTEAIFTVSLSQASGQPVTVDYNTANGTASTADYQPTSGQLTFPAGATQQTISVLIQGDTLDEADETFSVILSNPTGATISTGTGLGTILDDDIQADLQIGKSGTPSLIIAGELLTYTLTITNSGPAAATDVIITDTLPAGVTFAAGPGCTENSGMVTCSAATLNNGSSLQRTIAVTVDSSTTSDLSNTATVGSAIDDPTPANNSDTVTTTVQTAADMSIAKVDLLDPSPAGEPLTYTLTITNNGPSDATGVIVTDTLPVSAAFTAAAPASCTSASGQIICGLGSLIAKSSRQLTITVTPSRTLARGSVISNTALVAANQPDPAPLNNIVIEPTTIVTPAANLALTKAGSPDPVIAGQQLTYTLSITNFGPSDAFNIVVTDTLPAGVVLAAASPDCGGSGGLVTCTIVSLLRGNAVQRTIVVTVTSSATGLLANNAVVFTSESDDLIPANNSDTITTTVQTSADLAISKAATPDPVTAGEPLIYTLAITNAGPSDATGLIITDTLPAGVTFAAAPGCTEGSGTVTCTLASLASGGSVQRTIVVTVNSGTTSLLANNVSLAGGEPDPDGTNNNDTITTTVQAETDLQVSKTDSPDPVTAGEPLTYTLSITNAGPSDATGLVVTDTLPGGVTFAPTPGCAESGGVVTCTIAGLTSGGSVQQTIVVTVDSGTTGSLANNVVIGGSEADPDATNNSDAITTTVQAETDLQVSKSDTPDPVTAGQSLTYTLSITNAGPSDATNLVVTDTLPAGVTFASAPSCAESGGVVTCTIAGLTSGGSVQQTIVVTVDSGTTGSLANNVVIGGSEADPDATNNSDAITTTVQAETDLQVSKSDTPDPVTAGQSLTYTLSITNAGPSDATNLVVTDTLPAGVTFASAPSCAESGGVVTCTIAGLTSGGSVQRTIVVTVNSGTTGLLANNVVISGGEPDPDTTNNSDAVTTTVQTSADLAVSKAASPNPVTAGEILTYTLSITNVGPSDATGLVVTDTLPAGVTFANAPGCTESGGAVTCTLASLASGGSVQRTIVVTVNSGTTGLLTNSVVISGGEPDPDGTNNNDTITTTVQTSADLAVSKAASPNPVTAGEILTYTLSITNAGPSNATGLVVTDTLPAGVTFANAPGCTESGGTVTCTLASLASGGSVQRTIVVTVNSGTTGLLANNVVISGGEPDPDTTNNSDAVTTTVQTSADLAISKAATPDPVVAGQILTYTVIVTNAGPSDAQTVVVTDTLPLSVTIIGAAPATTTQIGRNLSWSLGALSAGASQTFLISVTVDSTRTTPLVNGAVITSSTPDPGPSPNSAVSLTTVDPQADLSISKTDTPQSLAGGEILTYTIVVTNHGPSLAQNVIITDTLPPSVTINGVAPATTTQTGQNVGWTFAALSSGASQTILVSVTVDSGFSGLLVNTATVTSTLTTDPGPRPNTASQLTLVSSDADLTISKTGAVDPVLAGQLLTYTLAITNNGPSDAASLTITDSLPLSTTFDSASPGCTGSGSAVTCTLTALTAGASAQFTISLNVDSAAVGVLTNSAGLSATTFDPDATNNGDIITTTVQAETDLQVSKSDTPNPVTAGERLTYTLSITNAGPSDATNLVVTDTLPAGVTFAAAPGCTESGGTVTCTIAGLTSNSSVQQTIVVAVNSGTAGLLANSVIIVGSEADPDATNNSDVVTTTVQTEADLQVSKSDTPNPVTAGQSLTYTLSISNAGPSDATNLVVTDTLPAGVIFAAAPGCAESGGVVTCTIAGLTSGSSVQQTVVVTVNSGTTGLLTNSVIIAGSEADPDATNNSDAVTTTVQTEADLQVSKADAPDPVIAGETLTYTLALTNAGPSDATGLVVTDTLPAGVTFAAAPGCTENSGVVTCTIAGLTSGGSVQRTIVVTVNSGTTGLLTNSVTVAGSQPDPDGTNNSAAITTTVQVEANLQVSKSDAPDPVIAGETLTYTLSITNAGPSDATGLVVTDTLPAGVTFANAPGCTESSGTVTCTFASLASGGSVQRTIVVTVNSGTTGLLANNVVISGGEPDPDGTNNNDTITTTVQTSADLAVSKADAPNPVTAGEPLTYTLSITNAGPSNATGLVVTDTLPAGVIFASAPGCAESGGTVTCTLASLASGGSVQRTIVVTVNSGTTGLLANNVSLAGSQPDPDGTNNNDTITTTVQTSADLAGSKAASPNPVTAGEILTYTLSITNVGPSDATGLVVTDTLPAGVTFANAPGCTESSGTVTCTLASLASGGSVQRTIVVTVNSGTTGLLANNVVISGGEPDPDGSNNNDTITTTVQAETDLQVSKADAPDPVTAGEPLTYTLSITNAGPSNATGLVVTDTLPAGVTFASAPGCTESGGAVTCTLASLASGGSVQRTIVVTVNSGTTGLLANNVSLAGSQPDPDGTNNNDTITTTVQTSADLAGSKAASPNPVTAGEILTYTLSITNVGPSDATGLVVTDTLPAGVTFANAPGCTESSGTVTCTLASLASGSSVQRTIVVTIGSGATGSLANSVVIAGSDIDPDGSNNSDTITTTVTTQADLSLSKNDAPDPVVAGQPLTYTLLVTNSGPSDAAALVITDTLPLSLTVSGTNPATTTQSGQNLVWNLGTLAIGASQAITITSLVDLNFSGVLTNSAVVSSTAADPVTVDNSDTVTTTVLAPAELAIGKFDSADPVIVGQPLTYTLLVTNNGPAIATGVVVTDTLPAGVTFGSATSGQGSCSQSGGVVTCTFGVLTQTGAAIAQSSFDTDADGWSISDNGVSVTPDFNAAGGNPGGYISDIDADANNFYFVAPAKFLGNQSAAYRGELAFDLQRSAGSLTTAEADVILGGGGITLTTQITAPGIGWSSYSLPLRELAWEIEAVHETPTQQQMLSVLANLTSLRIRGDYVTGTGDTGGLDNVRLSYGPATITIGVTPTSEGDLANNAGVSANEPDTSPINNTASQTTAVVYGLAINNTSVPEGNSGLTNMVFTVTLSAISGQTVSVNYATANGTARVDGFDYNASSGTLTFLPGATVQTLTVQILGDTLVEADETLFVTLSNPVNATLIDDQGTGAILNDDIDANTVSICLAPTADAYIHQDGEDHNHGDSNDMQTKPQTGKINHSLISFDTTPIPFNATVLTSTLFLYEDNTRDDQTILLHRLTNSWTETEVTWLERSSGAPWTTPGGDYITATSVATFTPNIDKVYRQIDVAGVTQSWVDGAFANHGLLLRATTTGEDGDVKFTARDDSKPEEHPQLCLTYGVPQADLAVTKTANNAAPSQGQSVVFTITVTNNGPKVATGVVISDTIPAGLTHTANSPSQGVFTPTSGVWNVGTIATATNASLALTATVNNGTAGTIITNTAAVSAGNELDPVPANNSDSAAINVVGADLSTGKSANSSAVIAGETLSYTLTITNSGPFTATNLIITDTLPAGVTLASAASCSSSGLTVTCTVASLNAGSTVQRTLLVTVTSSSTGSLVNTATTTATEADPDGSNNTATLTTTVQSQANLGINKLASANTVLPGSTFTYTLVAFNNGPSDAANVTVTDTLPLSVTLVTSSSSQGSCSGSSSVTCSLGTLANDSTATITLRVTVDPARTAPLVNTASITSATTDLDSADNTTTLTTNVGALNIAKSSSAAGPLNPGDVFTYTISVSNIGSGSQTNVTISDILPVGVSYVGGSSVVSAPFIYTVRDEFNVIAYNNNNGSENWSTSWTEAGETTNPSGGLIRVVSSTRCAAGNCLRLGGDEVNLNGRSVARQVNLTGVSSAELTFSYRRRRLDEAGGSIRLQASNNGGGSWTTLQTYFLNSSDGSQIPQSFDLTPYIAGNTQIRFLGAGSEVESFFYADNIQIEYSRGFTTTAGGAPPALVSGVVLLGPGETMTTTFQVQVDSPLTPTITTITNTASVTSDLQTTPLDASASNPVQQADLQLGKTGSPNPVIAGETLTYSLTITNNGPFSASGVVVTDTLPATGLIINGASPATTTQSGQTLVWNLGSMANGAVQTIQVTGTVASSFSGVLTNSAIVTTSTIDPIFANNSDTITTTAQAEADLSLIKRDSADPVVPGGSLTYTLMAVNSGPSDATNVSLTDTLPLSVTLVTSGASQGSCSGSSTVTCNLGTLASGSAATVTLGVTVDAGASAVLVNSANVTAATTDPDPAGNNAVENTQVGVLAITKNSGAGGAVVPGQIYPYTIVVENIGSAVETNVTISDTLPPGLSYVASSTVITAPIIETVRDEFSSISYSGNNGSQNWSAPWSEIGESNGTGSGRVRVVSDARCAAGNCARIGGLNLLITGFGLSRQADLSGAQTAILSFSYRRELLLLAGGRISLDASGNGGSSWADLQEYSLNGSDSGQVAQSFDISPYIANNSAIRFVGEGGLTNSNFFADNVQIQYSKGITSVAGGPPPTLASGFTLLPGDVMTVTFDVRVDNPLTPTLTTITNTAAVTSNLQVTPINDSAANAVQQADLSVTKVVNNAAPLIGAPITFTITAANAGPNDATNVSLSDRLPAGLGYISDNPSQGSYSSVTGLWAAGTITSGSTVTLTLVATPTAASPVTNSAQITASDQVDPDSPPGNNIEAEDDQQSVVITPTLPSLSVTGGISVTEGDSGATSAIFTVTLSSAVNVPVSVDYATSNGTAIAGSDYLTASGTLTFAPGTTLLTFTVTITGDTLDEANETYTVTLSNPTNAQLAVPTATGTIEDDDFTAAQNFVATADTWIDEGNPTNNNGADTILKFDPSAGGELRSLIQFDLSTIPASSTVLTATLQVRVGNTQSGQTIEIYRVITGWVEGNGSGGGTTGATWNQPDKSAGPPWSTAGGDYDSGTVWGSFSPATAGTKSISLTTLVQGWVDGTFDNYGVILVVTGSGGTSEIFSREDGTVANRPTLIIDYNELGGMAVGPLPGGNTIHLPLIIKSTKAAGQPPPVKSLLAPPEDERRLYLPVIIR